jgi:Zn finger protein HypA/HybF involved in hydrogenase expression
VITQEDGQDLVRYFEEQAAADAANSKNVTQAALNVIGAWSDLDWEEMEASLDCIQHGSRHTLPIIKL